MIRDILEDVSVYRMVNDVQQDMARLERFYFRQEMQQFGKITRLSKKNLAKVPCYSCQSVMDSLLARKDDGKTLTEMIEVYNQKCAAIK